MTKSEKTLTLEEKYVETALELALYRIQRKNSLSAYSENDGALEEEAEEFSRRTMQDMLKTIDKELRCKHSSKRFRECTFRIVKTVAALLLVVNLVLTIAVAADAGGSRRKVLEFFVHVGDSYAEFGYEETNRTIEVPTGWPTNCYPTYIPDGYTVHRVQSDGFSGIVEYQDNANNLITVSVRTTGGRSTFNVEGTVISYAYINGAEVTVLEQPYEETDVIWYVGDKYYVVTAPEKDLAFDIAESMMIVTENQ